MFILSYFNGLIIYKIKNILNIIVLNLRDGFLTVFVNIVPNMIIVKLFKYKLILKVYEYLIRYRIIYIREQYFVNPIWLYTNTIDLTNEYYIFYFIFRTI